MRFEISYDEHGKPTHVDTDDGFAQCCRPFDPETDGWMEHQLRPSDFLAVKLGRQMEELVHEVNALRRENFMLKRSERQWIKAAGF